MPFEVLLIALLAALGAAVALGLFALLRRTRTSPALAALGQGRFAEALAAARTAPPAERDELWAAAVAAKHLLRLDLAAGLLDRLLAADPGDGEAWLERGLVAAYAGDRAAAARAFGEAAARRSDLAESVTLHRAWLALAGGDRAAARRLFEEVEASLETKLRQDLGAGEPLFAEWFLHAAALWQALGDPERAAWARAGAAAAAPESRLAAAVAAPAPPF